MVHVGTLSSAQTPDNEGSMAELDLPSVQALATRAHAGQARRHGRAYVEHPIAVRAPHLTFVGDPSRSMVVQWTTDAATLASASFDGLVRFWEPLSGQCLKTLQEEGVPLKEELDKCARRLGWGYRKGRGRAGL